MPMQANAYLTEWLRQKNIELNAGKCHNACTSVDAATAHIWANGRRLPRSRVLENLGGSFQLDGVGLPVAENSLKCLTNLYLSRKGSGGSR